jgi:hypothetical protein
MSDDPFYTPNLKRAPLSVGQPGELREHSRRRSGGKGLARLVVFTFLFRVVGVLFDASGAFGFLGGALRLLHFFQRRFRGLMRRFEMLGQGLQLFDDGIISHLLPSMGAPSRLVTSNKEVSFLVVDAVGVAAVAWLGWLAGWAAAPS